MYGCLLLKTAERNGMKLSTDEDFNLEWRIDTFYINNKKIKKKPTVRIRPN